MFDEIGVVWSMAQALMGYLDTTNKSMLNRYCEVIPIGSGLFVNSKIFQQSRAVLLMFVVRASSTPSLAVPLLGWMSL